MSNLIILAAIVVAIWTAAPVSAQVVLPTLLDLNLTNTDGSNIDTGLLLTIDYLDSDSNSQSINSVDSSSIITWSIYNGKSNLYVEIPAKGGTDITVTVDGYEPVVITAAEGGQVIGNYVLSNVTLISPTTTTTSTVPSTTTTTTTSVNTTASITTTTLLLSNTNSEGPAEGGPSNVATTVSVEDEEIVMTAPSISSGSSATFTVPVSDETPVRQLVVKVEKDVQDLEVTVSILAAKPADVETEVGGVLYRYINISHTVSDAEINSATINFDVEKSWISDNNIDPDSVTLNRYSGGKWTALATTRLSDDTYEAVSPGLSVFGISASIVTDAPRTTTTTTPPATITRGISPPVTTVPPGGGKPIRKVLFAVLALAIVVFAAYYYRKK